MLCTRPRPCPRVRSRTRTTGPRKRRHQGRGHPSVLAEVSQAGALAAPGCAGAGRAEAWLCPRRSAGPRPARSALREPSWPLIPKGRLPEATAARSPARGPSSCAPGNIQSLCRGPKNPGLQSSLVLHQTLVWWLKISFRRAPPKLLQNMAERIQSYPTTTPNRAGDQGCLWGLREVGGLARHSARFSGQAPGPRPAEVGSPRSSRTRQGTEAF